VQAKLVSVRFGQTYYRGQILARTDSGIDTLSALAGRNFAFTDPLSASGYVFPAYHISKTVGVKVDDFLGQVVFTGNHFDAVRAVYYGVFDSTPIHAGASFEDARSTLMGEIPDIFTQTKVISYTDPIPNDAFCVRFGLDPLVAENVINALLTIADTQVEKKYSE
jgi:phosphonate transport system substrate-binding protein